MLGSPINLGHFDELHEDVKHDIEVAVENVVGCEAMVNEFMKEDLPYFEAFLKSV